jgi:hypothetical protein
MSGRVIIDTYAYYKSNNLVKPEMGSLGGGASGSSTTNEAAGDDGGDDTASTYSSDDGNDNDMSAAANHPAAKERVEDLTALSDEHCLLTTPWLIGFDLKAKTWGMYFPGRSHCGFETDHVLLQVAFSSTSWVRSRGTTKPTTTWSFPAARRSWPGTLSRARAGLTRSLTTLCLTRVSFPFNCPTSEREKG